jgi:SAM-dependent methyltransferase
MDISQIEPAYQAFTRDLIGRRGFDPARLHLTMAPGDEMFFKGVLPSYPDRPGAAFYRYVESALRTFEVYRQLADHLGGLDTLERVLDFGSGYGRLTRILSQRLDPSRIWVSDIYKDAVAWQKATFGVNGVDSAPDPHGFQLSGSFSIVFAASVFSHLPDGLFQRWLARLHGLVEPQGLLAFSVHGAEFAPEGQEIAAEGIGYAHWSESDTLDPAIYGMSYVTQDYVRGAVAQACGEEAARSLRVFPRALFESQDLYVVGGAACDLAGLDVKATPVGGVSKFGRDDRPWSGWGLEPNPGHQIQRVELFVGGEPAGAMTPTPDNEEVMRYFPGAPNIAVSWSFPQRSVATDTLVRVELTSSTGKMAYAYGMAPQVQGPGAART